MYVSTDEPEEKAPKALTVNLVDVFTFERHIYQAHIELLKSGKISNLPASFARKMSKLTRELAAVIQTHDIPARVQKLKEIYSLMLEHGIDLPN